MPFYQKPDYFGMGFGGGLQGYQQGFEQFWQNKAREQQLAFQMQQQKQQQDQFDQQLRQREMEFRADQLLARDRLSQQDSQWQQSFDTSAKQWQAEQNRASNNDTFNHGLADKTFQLQYDKAHPYGDGWIGKMMETGDTLRDRSMSNMQYQESQQKLQQMMDRQKLVASLGNETDLSKLTIQQQDMLGILDNNIMANAQSNAIQQRFGLNAPIQGQNLSFDINAKALELAGKNDPMFSFKSPQEQQAIVQRMKSMLMEGNGGFDTSLMGGVPGVMPGPRPQPTTQPSFAPPQSNVQQMAGQPAAQPQVTPIQILKSAEDKIGQVFNQVRARHGLPPGAPMDANMKNEAMQASMGMLTPEEVQVLKQAGKL